MQECSDDDQIVQGEGLAAQRKRCALGGGPERRERQFVLAQLEALELRCRVAHRRSERARAEQAEGVRGQRQGVQLGHAREELGECGEVAVVDIGQREVGRAVPRAHEEGQRLVLLVAREEGTQAIRERSASDRWRGDGSRSRRRAARYFSGGLQEPHRERLLLADPQPLAACSSIEARSPIWRGARRVVRVALDALSVAGGALACRKSDDEEREEHEHGRSFCVGRSRRGRPQRGFTARQALGEQSSVPK